MKMFKRWMAKTLVIMLTVVFLLGNLILISPASVYADDEETEETTEVADTGEVAADPAESEEDPPAEIPPMTPDTNTSENPEEEVPEDETVEPEESGTPKKTPATEESDKSGKNPNQEEPLETVEVIFLEQNGEEISRIDIPSGTALTAEHIPYPDQTEQGLIYWFYNDGDRKVYSGEPIFSPVQLVLLKAEDILAEAQTDSGGEYPPEVIGEPEPWTGIKYIGFDPLMESAQNKRFRTFALTAASRANNPPIIGEDHPENEGDVMLFKEAKPVEGHVNMWDVTLRIEAKDINPTNDIVLVIDTSGSMGDNNRMVNAKNAAIDFVNVVFKNSNTKARIKLVDFSSEVEVSEFYGVADKATLINKINGLQAEGGTFTQGGLAAAKDALRGSLAEYKNVVILSDGLPTFGYGVKNYENYMEDTYFDVVNTFYFPTFNVLKEYRYQLKRSIPEGAFDYGNTPDKRVGSGQSNLSLIRRDYFKEGQDQYLKGYYYNVANHAIDEAGFIKAIEGNPKIYSIGLSVDALGKQVLQAIGNNYYDSDPEKLQQVFNEIALSIVATVNQPQSVDPIAQGFQLLGDMPVTYHDGPVTDSEGTLNWTPELTRTLEGDSSIKLAELKYRVEINDDILSVESEDGKYNTNGNATLTYTDANGQQVGPLSFPNPKVDPILYVVKKVVLDAFGLEKTTNTDKFDINVTGPESYTKDYAMQHGDRHVLTDLRIASSYQIEETSAKKANNTDRNLHEYYDVKYKLTRKGEAEPFYEGSELPEPFLIEEGMKDVDIVVTNQEKPIGELIINKTFDNVLSRPRNLSRNADQLIFNFKVYGPKLNPTTNEIKIVELADKAFSLPTEDGKWTKTIDGLPYGTYRVEEVIPEGADYKLKSYSIDGVPAENGTNIVLDINKKSATIDVVNAVEKLVQLKVNKVWDGGTSPRPEITFELYRKSMAPGATEEFVKSEQLTDGKTSVTFKGLQQYDKKGYEYHYRVVEAPSPIPGYDAPVYEPENQINGFFIPKENATVKVTNKYNPQPAEISISGTKTLKNKDLTDGKFQFSLYHSNENGAQGDVIDTVQNQDGEFTFQTFELKTPGVFYYLVKEVNDAQGGITYDTNKYLIKVKVHDDDGDGKLNADISYQVVDAPEGSDTPESIKFANIYEAKGEWTPEVTKNLSGRDLEDGKFTFELLDANGKRIGEPVTNKSGKATFPAIEYTQADIGNTYTYTIQEIAPTPPETGMSYDLDPVKYSVTVTDAGNGKLTVTPVITSTDHQAINNSYEATGTWTPEVTKVLTGRPLKAEEFTFELIQVVTDEEGNQQEKVIQTAKNGADGKVTFEKITFDQTDVDKIYTFKIREVKPEPGETDMSYSGNVAELHVTVKDAGQGKLTITETLNSGSKTFENKYTAKGEWTPEVTKNLSGRDLEDGKFTFELLDANGKRIGEPVTNKSGKATFPAIEYTQADIGNTYTYTIQEIAPTPPETGMSYDLDPVKYSVTVTDAGNGKLTVTPVITSTDHQAINNSYEATGTWTPEVTKVLTGRPLKAEEFTFELIQVVTDEEGNPQETVIQTAKNGADGSITFDAITFSQENIGEIFEYKVVEKKPDPEEEGMTYSPMVAIYQFKVVDNGNGVLGLDYIKTPLKTEFENIYTASGSVTIQVRKSLTGRRLKPGEFTFNLTGHGENIEKANDASGLATFTINYTQEDLKKGEPGDNGSRIFTYKIKEIVPDPAEGGMTYDKHEVTVTVTVTDLGEGNLKAVATYAEGNQTFNNTYEATGQWKPEITKTLSGRELTKDEFTFELKLDGEVKQEVTNNSDGSVPFDSLKFNQKDIGTHTVTVREVKPAPAEAGMTYDDHIVTYTLVVADAGNSKLTVTAQEVTGETTFTNSYEAKGEWAPKVTKSLMGRSLKDKEFTFGIWLGNEATGEPLQKVTNAADGTVTFEAISYTQADIGQTYTYTIKEIKPESAEGGMTYDDHAVTVTVEVKDAKNGKLTVTPTYKGDKAFKNSYKATGSWTPEATKVLNGRDLTEGEFEFELLDRDKNLIEKKKNDVPTDKKAQVTFTPIQYTEKDINRKYTYYIREVKPNPAEEGMTYDGQLIKIEVTITDARGGKLNVSVTPDQEKILFTNSYEAKGEWAPKVTKSLTGRSLKDKEFTFGIWLGNEATGEPLQKVTNAADGTVTFEAISYTQADIGQTYTYTIKEIKPESAEGGMTYDDHAVTVTVEVKDAKNGKLTVTPTYKGDKAFKNSYKATGSWTPEATKVLNGRDLTEGEFSFLLKDEFGNELGTVQNTLPEEETANVVFETIQYTQKDIGKTYKYTIEEIVPDTPVTGMIYDETLIRVTVDISDAGQGKLNVSVTYEGDKQSFENVYALETEWTPEVSKELTGRTLKAGEFSFEWTDVTEETVEDDEAVEAEETVEDDETVETEALTVTHDADGKLIFEEPFKYTQDDIGKTYVYELKEIIPDNPEQGMTYDDQIMTIKVTIGLDEKGNLEVTVEAPEDPVFRNQFKETPPDEPDEPDKPDEPTPPDVPWIPTIYIPTPPKTEVVVNEVVKTKVPATGETRSYVYPLVSLGLALLLLVIERKNRHS